jgi:hypothetical protein
MATKIKLRQNAISGNKQKNLGKRILKNII